jgi:two-component system heavy metal sensor histidine kinase CusS
MPTSDPPTLPRSVAPARPSPVVEPPPGTSLKTAPAAGRGWSIATRLTVLYTVSAFGILCLAVTFLYWQLSVDLLDQEDRGLVDEITTLRLIISEHPNEAEQLRVEVEVESTARPFTRYYARICDEAGNQLMQTPGMDDVISFPGIFPPPLKVSESLRRGIKWKAADGRTYLCTAARAQVGSSRQNRRVIQLAMEVSQQEEMLSRYRHGLVKVLLAGMIGLGVVGSGIARRGMRPLQAITEAAQRITATQLNERISARAWPRELTTLATEFDEMLARLEDTFNRLSQFSADIAHELRTPINNLMGEVEVALSRGRTAPEYRTVLESSLEECSRLSRMITEVKIQASWFDATKEIRAVLDFYEALSAEEGVEVEAEGESTLHGDVILFRRALSNLLANALRYTPRGGKVRISIKNESDEAVEVRVVDNGAGISAEHLPKIFDRFYRVDPSRSRHPEGTGLGLAIVRSIMELHGGSVGVESQLGKGTTFTLRFPNHPLTVE